MSGLQRAAEQALSVVQTYAAACRAVGHPRITAERIRELYGTDDGLRMTALEADGAALAAAAAAAAEAGAIERSAIAELAQAWRGGSGSAATDFLGRQCAAGSDVAEGLSAAAAVLRSLRARLAEFTEARMEATVRIEDRRAADRPVWLARAGAVLAGLADESAVDTVRLEVAPFVDVDIAGDWASTMESISDAVAADYRAAAARLDDLPVARFEVVAAPPVRARPEPAGRGGQTAAPQNGPPAGGPPAEPAPLSPPLSAPAALPAPAPLPAPGPMSGVPDGWGGIGIAEPGRPVETLKARKRTRRPEAEQDEDSDESGDEALVEDDDEGMATDGAEPVAGAPVAPPALADPVPPSPVDVPPPPPVDVPPVDVPPAPPAALPAEAGFQPRTPCEIAADELPQVGQ